MLWRTNQSSAPPVPQKLWLLVALAVVPVESICSSFHLATLLLDFPVTVGCCVACPATTVVPVVLSSAVVSIDLRVEFVAVAVSSGIVETSSAAPASVAEPSASAASASEKRLHLEPFAPGCVHQPTSRRGF